MSYEKHLLIGYALDTICESLRFKRELNKEMDDVNPNLWGMFSLAHNTYMSFKLYYHMNSDLSHYEIDEFIDAYEVFVYEFSDSNCTSHSSQQTHLNFENMIQAYNNMADLLGLAYIKSHQYEMKEIKL